MFFYLIMNGNSGEDNEIFDFCKDFVGVYILCCKLNFVFGKWDEDNWCFDCVV